MPYLSFLMQISGASNSGATNSDITVQKHKSKYREKLCACALTMFSLFYANPSIAVSADYAPSSAEIINPERGFHIYRELDLLQPSYSGYNTREQGVSLLFLRILADDFRNQEFNEQALQVIRTAFTELRTQGVKANPRIVYALDASQQDAPLSVVLRHIEQLSPIWHEFKDVINVLDPGFVGAWGEWHTSTNGLDTPENRQIIINALLEALPVERMLLVRRPDFKRFFLTGSSDFSGIVNLTESTAFSGSANARIGHLNDCFASSASDLGTYPFYDRETEIDALNRDAAYLPWGGETCAVSSYNSCANTIDELTRLHANYLNIGYHPSVIANWETEGCYDTVRDRLGYRFSLNSATLSDNLAAGGIASIQLSLSNSGFGELFNERPVELFFVAENQSFRVRLGEDPRHWKAGTTQTFSEQFSLPSNAPAGLYDVYLSMPDASATLSSRSEFAIQMANIGIWNASLGANLLFNNVVIEDGVNPGSTPTPTSTPPPNPSPTSTPAPTTDLEIISAVINAQTLLLDVNFPATLGHQLFIDTDNDATSGFSIGGIGADILVESDLMYQFSGTSNTSWAWTFSGSTPYYPDGNRGTFEITHSYPAAFVRIIASVAGTSNYSEIATVIVPNALSTPVPTPTLTPTPTTPPPVSNFPNEETPYTLVSTTSNNCLDIAGASQNGGAELIEWRCNGNDNQRFILNARAEDLYTITVLHSGKVLQYSNSRTTFLQRNYSIGRTSQLFRLNALEADSYQLCSERSGVCIGSESGYVFVE